MSKQRFDLPMTATLVSALLLASTAARAEDVRGALEAANKGMVALYGKGDSAGVAALYATDGEVMPVGSGPVKGTEAIAKFWQGAMGAGVATVTLKTVEVYPAASTATEVGEYALADKSGKPIDHGKYVVIWKKVDGHWKLLRDMFSTNVTASK